MYCTACGRPSADYRYPLADSSASVYSLKNRINNEKKQEPSSLFTHLFHRYIPVILQVACALASLSHPNHLLE
ncbi:hypothetical protein EG331_10590 [Pectobacterium versatile]|nr:hypothetical protein EG331_10590 [Pectobacterium versatile]